MNTILVADPDTQFLKHVCQSFDGAELGAVTTTIGREAQKILAEKDFSIVGVVVNPKVDSPLGIGFISHCRLTKPGIPIYVIYDENQPFDTSEMDLLGLQGVLKKPIDWTLLSHQIQASVIVTTEAVEAASTITSTSDTTVPGDLAYTSIPIQAFTADTPLLFDVYVRLSPGKYVKIVASNQGFDRMQLANFISKGVRYFYLSKVAQKRYVEYCRLLASKILGDKRFALESKVIATLAHGHSAVRFLKAQGVEEEALEFAVEYSQSVERLIHQIELDKTPLIAQFLKELSKYEHAVSVSIIAALLASALDMSKERSIATVGLASLLHDIGLMKLSTDLYDLEDNEKLLTETQRAEFQTHPTLSAEILSKFPKIESSVIQAVYQHHERRTGKGFPHALGPSAISRMAEIVGISDEFVRVIERSVRDPFLDVLEECEKNIFDGFSFEVTEAFRRAFFPSG